MKTKPATIAELQRLLDKAKRAMSAFGVFDSVVELREALEWKDGEISDLKKQLVEVQTHADLQRQQLAALHATLKRLRAKAREKK